MPHYEFATPLLRLREGGMTFHYVPLPDDIADEIDEAGIRRFQVRMNGCDYNRAVQRRSTGERYMTVSRSMMRDIHAQPGDTVLVEMEPDPDPDNPEIPDELEIALDHDDEAAERFYAMTPGRRRGLAHYVDSAKRPETREKRALELAYKLRTYTLHGDKG